MTVTAVGFRSVWGGACGATLGLGLFEGFDSAGDAVQECGEGGAFGDGFGENGNRAALQDDQHRVGGEVGDGRFVGMEEGSVS